MKNITFPFVLFLFAIIYTGCPYWCEPSTETASLPNVSFTISPEKENYVVDEEMVLAFSQIPDFSFFGKYSFEIKLEELDETTGKYITTDKVFFVSEQGDSDSIDFAYEEKDLDNPAKVEKSFSIKATEQGTFLAYIHGSGYTFNNKGGYSVVGYNKSILIDVVE